MKKANSDDLEDRLHTGNNDTARDQAPHKGED